MLKSVGDADGGDDRLAVLGNRAVVIRHGRVGADGIHDLDALGDMAEGSILAVEEGAVLVDNEELAAGTVGMTAASHGDDTADMGDVILHTVQREFALDVMVGAAGAGAEGAAALHHEAFHNAVEGEAVIETGFRQFHEVLDGDLVRAGASLERLGPSSSSLMVP